MSTLVAVLLGLGVLACLLSGVGVLAMRRPLDRLHFTGIATVLGTIPLTLAVVLHAGLDDVTVKALAVAAVVLVTGPVLNQVTGRAIVTRTGARPLGEDWEVTR